MTPHSFATEVAGRLGERAGRRFMRSGIWPRNPFRTAELEPLAAEWRRAVFAAVGPALRPH
jgi:hypothetical protein